MFVMQIFTQSEEASCVLACHEIKSVETGAMNQVKHQFLVGTSIT
jgi:hypothetical protein